MTTEPKKFNPPQGMNNRYERSDGDKWALRPNNYAIKVAIISGGETLHLPIVKQTGHGSIREYLYTNDVTMEKTTRNMIIYLKKRFVRVITKEEEFDQVEKDIKEFMVTKLLEFLINHPEVKLDWTRAQLIKREIGVKDPNLKIHPSLRMKDTIFKKVYNKSEPEFYNPALLKQYIKNRSIENWSPELANKMDFIIDREEKFARNYDTHLEVLHELKDAVIELKEAYKPLYLRIWNWMKRLGR